MWEKNELSSLSYYSKLFYWSYFKNRQRWQLITETKREKTSWAFLFQKYSKIWSVSHFIKYKPHISEEWQQKRFQLFDHSCKHEFFGIRFFNSNVKLLEVFLKKRNCIICFCINVTINRSIVTRLHKTHDINSLPNSDILIIKLLYSQSCYVYQFYNQGYKMSAH